MAVALEQVWKRCDTTVAPLCIIDFRVHMHHILSSVKHVPEAMQKQWLQHVWRIRLNRGPDALSRIEHRVIVVDDYKDEQNRYWRNLLLPSYKGDRSRERCGVLEQVCEIGHQVALKDIGHIYRAELFEADDWAGVVHRIKLAAKAGPLSQRECYYSTVDGDWQQLVDDATKQYWVTTGPWQSRLKNEHEVRCYVSRKLKEIIHHPREIALAKHKRGDMGDNLPAGSPIELFDLCNRHDTYSIEQQHSELHAKLAEDMSTVAHNTCYVKFRSSLEWCLQNGLPVTITQ